MLIITEKILVCQVPFFYLLHKLQIIEPIFKLIYSKIHGIIEVGKVGKVKIFRKENHVIKN